MEHNQEFRSKSAQIYPSNFWQRCKIIFNREGITFSVNGAGAIKHPSSINEHFIQKLVQNGLCT